MPKDERLLWGGVGILAIALVCVAFYKLSLVKQQKPIRETEPAERCDLNQRDCVGVDRLGKVILNIQPRPIPLVQPITLSVRTTIPGIERAEIDFRGVDMDMGQNRFILENKGNGIFEGKAMLPVCVRSRMTWEARVLLTRSDVIVAAPYRFDTGARH